MPALVDLKTLYIKLVVIYIYICYVSQAYEASSLHVELGHRFLETPFMQDVPRVAAGLRVWEVLAPDGQSRARKPLLILLEAWSMAGLAILSHEAIETTEFRWAA